MHSAGAGEREPSRLTTYFAPAERATPEALERAVAAVSGDPLMGAVLRSLGGIVMVLNAQRQILAVNDALLRLLGCEDPQATLGLRPGEALGCVHARDNPEGGCGTSRFCATCGAAIAIVSSQESGAPAEAECLLTARVDGREEAFEFRVRAAPIAVRGEPVLVISLQDIRDQKRREALERIFFHDVMNTANALRAAARLLAECEGDEREEIVGSVAGLTDRLIREIADQRDLLDLEDGRYQGRRRHVSLGELRDLAEQLSTSLPLARARTLAISREGGDAMLHTDPVLVGRVLANMVKNALEATPEGGEVRLGVDVEPDRVVFHVWNAGAMAPEVALRIFQRHFTTKDEPGRGLGTWGMKLIGERYLGGTVSFTTSEAEGTTFRLALPLEPARD